MIWNNIRTKFLSLFLTIIIVISVFMPCVTTYGYANYIDVFNDHWAYEAINYATINHWFGGYSDGSFQPNKTISRAEAVKVLVSYLNRKINTSANPGYMDVSVTDWFAPYVECGKELLPNALKENYFRPNEAITREDTIYALVRSLELNKLVEYVNPDLLQKYADGQKVAGNIKVYFAIAIQTALVSGYKDNTVRPQNPLTRAEFATLLYRALLIKRGEKGEKLNNTPSEKPQEVIDAEEETATLFSGVDLSVQNNVADIINDIRKKNGLTELKTSNELIRVAQLKAEDMQTNNYFSYTSPQYGTLSDMLKQFKIGYRRCAGANMEKGISSAEQVVQKWMKSEYEKARILRKEYSQIGVGFSPENNIWVAIFIG